MGLERTSTDAPVENTYVQCADAPDRFGRAVSIVLNAPVALWVPNRTGSGVDLDVGSPQTTLAYLVATEMDMPFAQKEQDTQTKNADAFFAHAMVMASQMLLLCNSGLSNVDLSEYQNHHPFAKKLLYADVFCEEKIITCGGVQSQTQAHCYEAALNWMARVWSCVVGSFSESDSKQDHLPTARSRRFLEEIATMVSHHATMPSGDEKEARSVLTSEAIRGLSERYVGSVDDLVDCSEQVDSLFCVLSRLIAMRTPEELQVFLADRAVRRRLRALQVHFPSMQIEDVDVSALVDAAFSSTPQDFLIGINMFIPLSVRTSVALGCKEMATQWHNRFTKNLFGVPAVLHETRALQDGDPEWPRMPRMQHVDVPYDLEMCVGPYSSKQLDADSMDRLHRLITISCVGELHEDGLIPRLVVGSAVARHAAAKLGGEAQMGIDALRIDCMRNGLYVRSASESISKALHGGIEYESCLAEATFQMSSLSVYDAAVEVTGHNSQLQAFTKALETHVDPIFASCVTPAFAARALKLVVPPLVWLRMRARVGPCDRIPVTLQAALLCFNCVRSWTPESTFMPILSHSQLVRFPKQIYDDVMTVVCSGTLGKFLHKLMPIHFCGLNGSQIKALKLALGKGPFWQLNESVVLYAQSGMHDPPRV